MLGVPGGEKRARAEKLAPMLAFLKEGVRFALAGSAQEPGRLGFLSALKPFLPHLNAPPHNEKLKASAKIACCFLFRIFEHIRSCWSTRAL